DCFCVVADGFVVFFFQSVGVPSSKESNGKFRVKVQSLRAVGNRLIALLLPRISSSSREIGLSLTGTKADSLRVIVNRLIELFLLGVGDSSVDVGASALGIEPNRLGVIADGLCKLFLHEV